MSEEIEVEMDSTENLEVVADMPTATEEASEASDVDNMSDEEFAKHMDGESDTPTDEPEVVTTESTELSLDDLYATQMEEPEAKLDKPVLVKYNGSVHKVDSVRELKNLAEQGIAFTRKSQELSDQTQLFDRLKANGYDNDSLMRLAEQDKGEPLMQMDTNLVEIDNVANEILQSNYVEAFQEVSNQFPTEVQDEMRRNPQMLRAIAYDVESGLAGSIMPEVTRMMNIQGVSFNDAYVQAGKNFQDNKTVRENNTKKLDSQPRGNTRQTTQDSKSVWDMDDDEFSKYFD